MVKAKKTFSQIYIFVSVIIQLLLSTAIICWQAVEITGTNTEQEDFNSKDIMFYFFWIGIFAYSIITASILIFLKKKGKIRAQLTGIYQYSLVADGAFIQIASILFFHDASHDKGVWLYLSIVILLFSFMLTTLSFYIGSTFQKKQHQININIAEQLEKDIKNSKDSYKKIEEIEEEKIVPDEKKPKKRKNK